MHFLPESRAFTHKATLASHWHSWRITLDESPVTINIWGLRALAVNQNTEVVPGWCREQLVDAQGRSHSHFQSVLPHYLCHRATSSTVAFLCVDFFSPPTLISASNLTFCLPEMSPGKETGLPHHVRPNIVMGRSSVVPKTLFYVFPTIAQKESWKVCMVHCIRIDLMHSCNILVYKELNWQNKYLHRLHLWVL